MIRLLVAITFFSAVICKKYNHNVGTTLFSETDNLKKCWNRDDIALLASRKILQDILPSEDVINIGNDKYINHIIDYFRLILEVVRNLSYGKSKHLVLLALSDTLGGYMNEFLLPVTRFAYYCGSVSYDSVQKLYSLFGELKSFLKTNGGTWAKADNSWAAKRNMHLSPYRFSMPRNNSKACDNIIFYQHLLPKGPGDQSRRRTEEHVIVPLPFFDSHVTPTAIAIPFKTFALRNIESKGSAFILVKYYVAARRCIVTKENGEQMSRAFDYQFNEWVHREVLPHLKDDKFYAAFGGILRIVENLKQSGIRNEPPGQIGGYHIMPKLQRMYHNMSEGQAITTDTPDLEALVNTLPTPINGQSSTGFIVLSLLIALFVWIILGTIYVCCRLLFGKRGRYKGRGGPICDPKECKEVAMSHLASKSNKSKYSSGESSRTDQEDDIGDCLCNVEDSPLDSRASCCPSKSAFSMSRHRRIAPPNKSSYGSRKKSLGSRRSGGSDQTSSGKSSPASGGDVSPKSGNYSAKSGEISPITENQSMKSGEFTPESGELSPHSGPSSPASAPPSRNAASPKSASSPASGGFSPSGNNSPQSQLSQSGNRSPTYDFKYELEDTSTSGFTTDEELGGNRSR